MLTLEDLKTFLSNKNSFDPEYDFYLSYSNDTSGDEIGIDTVNGISSFGEILKDYDLTLYNLNEKLATKNNLSTVTLMNNLLTIFYLKRVNIKVRFFEFDELYTKIMVPLNSISFLFT